MRRWLALTVLVLIVMSMACSLPGLGDSSDAKGDGDEAQATLALTAAAPQPTAAAETGPEKSRRKRGEDEEPPAASGDVGLEAISSYRAGWTWTASFADGSMEEVLTSDEAVREPFAMHSVIVVKDTDSTEEIEIIHVDGTHWTRYGDEWLQIQSELGFEDNQTLTYFADVSAMLEGYEYLGKETIAGISTRHYRRAEFTDAQAELFWLLTVQSSYSLGEDLTEFRNVSDEVWVADEPDLPMFAVRWVREGEAKDPDGELVTFTDVREVLELNVPFTIEPPTGAMADWPPDDVPVYPGATVDTSMAMAGGGMLMLISTDDVDTVAAYYRDALPGSGWSEAETTDIPGMVMETWTKGERSMNLLINVQDGGGCSVTVMVSEEE